MARRQRPVRRHGLHPLKLILEIVPRPTPENRHCCHHRDRIPPLLPQQNVGPQQAFKTQMGLPQLLSRAIRQSQNPVNVRAQKVKTLVRDPQHAQKRNTHRVRILNPSYVRF